MVTYRDSIRTRLQQDARRYGYDPNRALSLFERYLARGFNAAYAYDQALEAISAAHDLAPVSP